eukprot:3208593-Pleurochrysis_carterae.AAC.1
MDGERVSDGDDPLSFEYEGVHSRESSFKPFANGNTFDEDSQSDASDFDALGLPRTQPEVLRCYFAGAPCRTELRRCRCCPQRRRSRLDGVSDRQSGRASANRGDMQGQRDEANHAMTADFAYKNLWSLYAQSRSAALINIAATSLRSRQSSGRASEQARSKRLSSSRHSGASNGSSREPSEHA